MVKLSSLVVDSTVSQCPENKQPLNSFEDTLAKVYEYHPVNVEVIKILEQQQYKNTTTEDSDSLLKIRDLEYGVLLLSLNETRGVDYRFGRDAKVLIICQVCTYHEYYQIIGRSSRTRGVCQGTLYIVSDERSASNMDRVKHQGASLQVLEKLMQVYEIRAKDSTLIRIFMSNSNFTCRCSSLKVVKTFSIE